MDRIQVPGEQRLERIRITRGDGPDQSFVSVRVHGAVGGAAGGGVRQPYQCPGLALIRARVGEHAARRG
jgi:hypothetical protein